MAAQPAALRLQGIVKRFPGVIANREVDFEVHKGEIHALLGENGSGKSTLMKIAYGIYQPDAGRIEIGGVETRLPSPQAAVANGIGMVHQHFALVPTLSVVDNIMLGFERRRGLFLDRTSAAEHILQVYKDAGLPTVDPNRLVGDLSVGEQQRVEIVKALAHGAETLILDEPTAVLTPQEVDHLGEMLERLRSRDYAIVFITHKLREVKRFCDRVTVLRHGRRINPAQNTSEATERDLATLMVGRELDDVVSVPKANEAEPILALVGVSTEPAGGGSPLRDVDFEVRPGEIVGVAGVDGNGQRALGETLAGVRSPVRGEVRFRGSPVENWKPATAMEYGISFVPEDRLASGLVKSFTIAENLALKGIDSAPFSNRGRVAWSAVYGHAENLVGAFDIRPPVAASQVSVLSGGNQQKVILARELTADSCVVIVAEPTRGLDVGSIETIHKMLIGQRDAGRAVVVISTDLDEIMTLADRVAVIYEGRIVAHTPRETTTRDEVGLLMAGGSAE